MTREINYRGLVASKARIEPVTTTSETARTVGPYGTAGITPCLQALAILGPRGAAPSISKRGHSDDDKSENDQVSHSPFSSEPHSFHDHLQ